MNNAATSKEAILKVSRKTIREQGREAVNIRNIALECGVSAGTIYNYFQSKSELLAATTESIWQHIFHVDGSCRQEVFADVTNCVLWVFERLRYGAREYPGFYSTHSMSLSPEEKQAAALRMHKTWTHILAGLELSIRQDPHVREGAFDESFTEKDFAEILFALILASLITKKYEATPVLELIKRTLY